MQQAIRMGRFALIVLAGILTNLAHSAAASARSLNSPTSTQPSTFRALVIAQAGSVGGTIGNPDKSLSGGQDAPSPPPQRRSKAPPPQEAPPRRSSSGSGGGGNYDGAWAVVSSGQTCNVSSTTAVVITSGRLVGQGLNGQVSGGGSVSATWQGDGVTSYSSGRLSGRSGSGSFRRSDGCVGRWTAVKQ